MPDYEPNNWAQGDWREANDLNHIENAISTLNSGVSTLNYAVATMQSNGNYILSPIGEMDAGELISTTLQNYNICYLKPGTYYIKTTITLPENSYLYGSGQETKLLVDNTAVTSTISSPFILCSCASSAQISNLTLCGVDDTFSVDDGIPKTPVSTNYYYGVSVSNSNNTDEEIKIKIHNCWIQGFWMGIVATTGIQVNQCVFQHNYIGLSIGVTGTNNTINDNYFIDNYQGTYAYGGTNHFYNCMFVHNYLGAHIGYITGMNNNMDTYGAFNGCSFKSNTYRGIEFYNLSIGFLISNCYFKDNIPTNSSGSYCDIYTNSPGIMVTGCYILDNSKFIIEGRTALINFIGCQVASTPTLQYPADTSGYQGKTRASSCLTLTGSSADNSLKGPLDPGPEISG